MLSRIRVWMLLALGAGVIAGLGALQTVEACGGFFCQTTPVDQNAERIIFAQNRDGTLSTYIQIEYTGFAPDFSWILPLPEPIGPEDVEVPEDAMSAFIELEVATDPVIMRPELPQCAIDARRARAERQVEEPVAEVSAESVEVFASGEVGPYGFDVVGSEDPMALIDWLREHEYQVTEPMVPLINVYVEEQFVFLAMRLLPDQGARDVQPVKVTYPAENPMIPLRLTAVAANPNMAVMVWIYADTPAVPANYANLEIADTDLTFFTFGGNNYRQLMRDGADKFRGQAFVTEYAAPSRNLAVVHPLLRDLRERHPYVTRLNTVISPEEMTVDPVFDYDPQRKDVSNIRDLTKMTGLFDCERAAAARRMEAASVEVPAADMPSVDARRDIQREEAGSTDAGQSWAALVGAGAIGGLLALLAAGLVAVAIVWGRRVKEQ